VRAGTPGNLAQLLKGGDVRLHETESALVESRIDDLTLARARAIVDRHHRPEGRVQAGDVIGEGGRHARWRPVRLAGDLAQATDRLADHPVAAALAVRTLLAEATDAH